MRNMLWEDQEIKFDLSFSQMNMRNGEQIIDQLDFIEDTKGNGGDKGRLLITNLRIIWHSLLITRISLSIGYNCIQSISTKIVNSVNILVHHANGPNCNFTPTPVAMFSPKRLKGVTEALHILTKYNGCRYEFIFTNLIPGNSRHFTSVMGVHRAYLSSKVYRELKLRGAIVNNKQLKTLEKEKLYFTVNSVWNLSSDQGNLGTFLVTNVRLVWFAEMNQMFNVSLPYIQIASIRIRESKFGLALVVESTLGSGGYVLGFRLDPPERLYKITEQLQNLYRVHSEHPELGIYYTVSTVPLLPEQPAIVQEEITEFDENLNDLTNALLTYSIDQPDETDSKPVYCSELGLAIEKLKAGYEMKSLWEVLPTTINNNSH